MTILFGRKPVTFWSRFSDEKQRHDRHHRHLVSEKGELNVSLLKRKHSAACKRDAVASIGFVLPRRRAYRAKGLSAPGTLGEREVIVW